MHMPLHGDALTELDPYDVANCANVFDIGLVHIIDQT